MFLEGSMGKQQISSQTVYDQIVLLDSDYYVKLTRSFQDMRLIPHSRKCDSKNYCEDLLAWFNKWRSIFFSLIDSGEIELPLLFDISGGVDSRMMLSLALTMRGNDQLLFYTQNNMSEDAKVARMLCENYGVDLSNESPDWGRLPIDDQYRLYTIGNSGFFNRPVTGTTSCWAI